MSIPYSVHLSNEVPEIFASLSRQKVLQYILVVHTLRSSFFKHSVWWAGKSHCDVASSPLESSLSMFLSHLAHGTLARRTLCEATSYNYMRPDPKTVHRHAAYQKSLKCKQHNLCGVICIERRSSPSVNV